MLDVVGLLPALAATVVYIALIVTLAGLVSGIVALGIMQTFGRSAIQRRVLGRFFAAGAIEEDFADEWGRSRFPRAFREGGVRAAARILRMPEQLLCSLYYRQITGQLLAAANVEASAGDIEGSTPVLDMLAWRADDAGAESPSFERGERDSARLHAASRAIDVLQAMLGQRTAAVVAGSLLVGWTAVYLIVGISTVARMASARSADAGAAAIFSLVATGFGAVALAALLAACSSAVGLAAFNWLERFSAPR